MFEKLKKTYLISIVLLVSVFSSAYSSTQVSKFQVLYIYNICRFVEWPADFNSTEFVIGVVGKNPEIEAYLNEISQSKKIQNKKVSIKVISSPAEGAKCNIVFFSEGNDSKINSYLALSPNSLIFSESSAGLKNGADINFYLDETKLKYDLADSNLSKKSLKTSNELKLMAANIR